MRIEERLTRRAPDDIIYIGNLIENAMRGELWAVINFMSASLKVEEIEKSKNGLGTPISAERILGRIEAYETLITNLESIVVQKEELSKPITKKKEVDEGAEEPIQTDDLYEPHLNYGGSV